MKVNMIIQFCINYSDTQLLRWFGDINYFTCPTHLNLWGRPFPVSFLRAVAVGLLTHKPILSRQINSPSANTEY